MYEVYRYPSVAVTRGNKCTETLMSAKPSWPVGEAMYSASERRSDLVTVNSESLL